MTDPEPITSPSSLPQAHEPWRMTADQYLESLGWAPIRRARPLSSHGGHQESSRDRLASFMRAGSSNLPPDSYVWVALTPDRVSRAMGLDQPRPVILRSRGWGRGLKPIEKAIAGISPEKAAGLIISAVREPDRVEAGPSMSRWRLRKRLEQGGEFWVELRAGSDFLEIVNAAKDG